ncbi:MAG: CocE/NonD family hydrolase [Actinomycetes bacterium]
MLGTKNFSRLAITLALTLIATFGLAHVSIASAIDVSVRGSVDAVYVSTTSGGTAAAGVSVTLYSAANATIGTGVTDSHGALVFHDVVPGASYHVTVGGFNAPAFSVLDTKAPNAAIYSGAPLHEGLNYITMRDGIKLAATVRLPDGKTLANGPFVTLIEYSGYTTAAPHSLVDAYLGRAGHPSNDPLLPSTSTALGSLIAPSLGFASVSLQIRGSGCSGGAFDLFGPTLATDGYDAIERISRESWVANHQVGLIGISYSGISQFAVAGLQPPHLAAIAPMSPTNDLFATGSPGGIRNTGFAAGWIADRVKDAKAAPLGQSWTQAQIDTGDTVCAGNQTFHEQAQDVNAILAAHDDRTPSLYDVRSPQKWASSIKVPVFLTGGLHDEQTGPQWPALIGALSKDKDVWVTMQNGTHVDSFSPAIFTRWHEFLNLFVGKRKPTTIGFLGNLFMSGAQPTPGATFPAVRFTSAPTYASALASFKKDARIRVLFDNGNSAAGAGVLSPAYEAGFTAFPPTTAKPTTYYLGANGALLGSAPRSGSTTYKPDPSTRPATSAGSGFNAWAAQPNYNWTAVTGTDGAGFLSSALTKNTTVVGPASLNLRLASTATDTDIQVTVSEVRANGQEMYVTSGFLRARYHTFDTKASTPYAPVPLYTASSAQALTPGQAVNVRVPINPIAFTFRTGSKIRITISAPGGDRPTWAFGSLVTNGAVTNTIYFGASSLVLPVVSTVTPTDSQPACGSNRGQPCRTYVAAGNGG